MRRTRRAEGGTFFLDPITNASNFWTALRGATQFYHSKNCSYPYDHEYRPITPCIPVKCVVGRCFLEQQGPTGKIVPVCK